MKKRDEKPVSKLKKLTLINVITALFTSIFLVDAIVPAAATGASTVIWYGIFAILFFIPYALITAEFSSKIPDEGGVYAWVKKTLGTKYVKRVAWYYWINVGIWAPSISLFMTIIMRSLWFPNYNNAWVTMIISLVFMWASLAFSYFPIVDNKRLYQSATIGKISIVIALFVGAFIFIAQGRPSETDFGKIPSELANAGGVLTFLPALIYNILGLEVISGEVKHIENPKKNMPKAIIITVLALIIFYIATTWALQYILHSDNIVDLSGLITGFYNAFGTQLSGKIAVNILGIIFIYTMFVETMGWVSGGNASVFHSAENGELPKIFTKTNKKGMPFRSSIMLGIIGSVEMILFTGIQEISGNNEIFWALFGASSNILFLSYLIMFFAYIKSKKNGMLDKLDGFSNKKWLGITMASIAGIIMLITWFLLLWSPNLSLIDHTIPVTASVIVALLSGEICFWYASKQNKKRNENEKNTSINSKRG